MVQGRFFLYVGSSFYRDIVGHAVGVTGQPGLGTEVITDVHYYTLEQEHQADVHSFLW